MKKCGNCKYRFYYEDFFGSRFQEPCGGYDECDTEADEIKRAATCEKYEEGDPQDDEEYCPSATAGDYSPSCPWNAPGCSVKMFI